jgi:hypothetical protein
MLAGTHAIAQPAQGTSVDALMMSYYKDPRPERLTGFFAEFQKLPNAKNWNVYPPLAGFFAIIFRADPGQSKKLFVAPMSNSSAEAFAAALQLSANPSNKAMADRIRASLSQNGMHDQKLAAELANLPDRLEDLKIASATHLDILWGAAFASGDAKFVNMIMDFYAQTANRSPSTALDIATIVVALGGGPKDIFGEVRGRYGDEGARQIIYAATALWAIAANAKQHLFVARAVAKYVEDHPGTPAQKTLAALRLKEP